MPKEALHERIADQFSYRDERADVWRAFDRFLDTDRYLNLGYSARYQPHLLGSSQRRLVDHVGSIVAAQLPATDGVALLDVGCGRGGPAARLADRYGFRVLGVDLVPYNVARARANAAETDASFVVGDAAALPLRTGSVTACTAIDSIVYLPEPAAVFAELSRVLDAGGVLVASDLVVRSGATDVERRAVDAFAEAWDMPPIRSVDDHVDALAESGFEVRRVADVSPHSVGRFRRWTTPYRWLTAGPTGRLVEWLLRRYDLNPAAIDEQIRRAHAALPALRHVVLVAGIPAQASRSSRARRRSNSSPDSSPRA